MKTITLETATVSTLTLNRPTVHNAFNDLMIQEMIEALQVVAANDQVRCLVIKGNGKSFCAGADLAWMQRMVDYSEEENIQDSLKLSQLMQTLNTFPKPTIAVVHGHVYGGGVGLVACCDMALADEASKFCLSEVKLGLIPAVISPYVCQAMGARTCRRYFLTGEVFTANDALTHGLVHELYKEGKSQDVLTALTQSVLEGAPHAQTAAKVLIQDVQDQSNTEAMRSELAHRIARIRVSPDAQDRLKTFLNKKK